MNTVNLKINNIPVVAPEGATILEAAHLAGIRIAAETVIGVLIKL